MENKEQYIISFFGHKDCDAEKIKPILYTQLQRIIKTNVECIFLLGGYGNFDHLVFEVGLELKKKFSNIQLHYVMPYKIWDGIEWYKNLMIKSGYDKCVYFNNQNTYPKYAIINRNKEMVKISDFILFYFDENINRKSGTSMIFEYALQKHKTYLNLFNLLNFPF